MGRKAVLIAGPTASGKSALALARAAQSGGVVVNADSMQVYDVLSVLTARPTEPDRAAAEHLLYGFVPPSERFSVGQYQARVGALRDDPALGERVLIFAGGTGLYFEALETGIADIPEVPDWAVAEARALVEPLDRDGRRALLVARDPEMASRLHEPDPQRLTRALSVLIGTKKSLAQWQNRASPPPLAGFEIERLVLEIDRDELSRRIEARFRDMLDQGAVAEVEALLELGLAPDLPAMKAIGVREIAAWQRGEITREDAVAQAVVATRQYAKRQRTWFRQRLRHWSRISSTEWQR